MKEGKKIKVKRVAVKTPSHCEKEALRFYRMKNLMQPPELVELSDLDLKMEEVLSRSNLSPQQKLRLYYNTLSRFRQLLSDGTHPFQNIDKKEEKSNSTSTPDVSTTPAPPNPVQKPQPTNPISPISAGRPQNQVGQPQASSTPVQHSVHNQPSSSSKEEQENTETSAEDEDNEDEEDVEDESSFMEDENVTHLSRRPATSSEGAENETFSDINMSTMNDTYENLKEQLQSDVAKTSFKRAIQKIVEDSEDLSDLSILEDKKRGKLFDSQVLCFPRVKKF